MYKNTNLDKNLSQWLGDTEFNNPQILGDAEALIQQGQEKTLTLFKRAAQQVPAYKDFLRKHKVAAEKITSFADFSSLPTTDKSNYIDRYPINLRCWGGQLEGNHIISTSSGTAGHPYAWPRDLASEIEGAYAHELWDPLESTCRHASLSIL